MLEILHNQPNDDLTQRILYFMFNFSDEPLNQKLIRELGGISLFSRYLTKHLEIAKLNPQDDKLDTIMALWFQFFFFFILKEESSPITINQSVVCFGTWATMTTTKSSSGMKESHKKCFQFSKQKLFVLIRS